jgi:hypothetical protein
MARGNLGDERLKPLWIEGIGVWGHVIRQEEEDTEKEEPTRKVKHCVLKYQSPV